MILLPFRQRLIEYSKKNIWEREYLVKLIKEFVPELNYVDKEKFLDEKKNVNVEGFINTIKSIHGKKNEVPLHALFRGNEIDYLKETIQSSFVSSLGEYVTKLESSICKFTGSNFCNSDQYRDFCFAYLTYIGRSKKKR